MPRKTSYKQGKHLRVSPRRRATNGHRWYTQGHPQSSPRYPFARKAAQLRDSHWTAGRRAANSESGARSLTSGYSEDDDRCSSLGHFLMEAFQPLPRSRGKIRTTNSLGSGLIGFGLPRRAERPSVPVLVVSFLVPRLRHVHATIVVIHLRHRLAYPASHNPVSCIKQV